MNNQLQLAVNIAVASAIINIVGAFIGHWIANNIDFDNPIISMLNMHHSSLVPTTLLVASIGFASVFLAEEMVKQNLVINV